MRTIVLSVLVISLGAATGCKKQQTSEVPAPPAQQTPASDATAPAEESPPAEVAVQPQPTAPAQQPPAAQKAQQPAQVDKLPGAAVIRTHLKNKDYSQAVGGLMALRGVANVNSDIYLQYRQLCGEVGETLQEAAKTDPKAAQALATYAKVLYGSNPNP